MQTNAGNKEIYESVMNYKKENENGNEKQYEGFVEERYEGKLMLRKKKLFNELMEKRVNKLKEVKWKIEDIAKIINEGMSFNKKEDIEKGIYLLKEYVDNNEKEFNSKNKKYLLENIYYALLDLFKHYHVCRNNILHIFIELTAIDDIFINNLMKDDIISYLSPIINENTSTNTNETIYYMSLILLSNCMAENINYYNIITNSFQFDNIIHKLINTNDKYIKTEYGDVRLIIISSFLFFLPKQHMYFKYKFIAEYILQNQFPSLLKNSNDNIDDILDIAISLSKNKKMVTYLLENGVLDIINIIIKEIPLHINKAYLLLSKLLLKSNDIQIQKILPYNDNIPFMKELLFYITNPQHNMKLIINIFHCIRNTIMNSEFYSKLYLLNNEFLSFLITLFNDNTIPNNIRTEIIIVFIVAMNTLNNQIQALLYKSNICKYVIQYINENNIYKISEVFLTNALSLMELFLLYGEELGNNNTIKTANKINYVKIEMDNYNFSNILNKIILSNNNKKLIEKAKSIDIKYWSENETYYQPHYKMLLD